jgi:hypothetical protein
MLKGINTLITILFYSMFGSIAIISLNELFKNRSRLGGVIFCICASIIDLPILRENLNSYRQSKQNSNEKKAGSMLLRLSQSAGLIFMTVYILIYVIINWKYLY